jgi:hypothetical protein
LQKVYEKVVIFLVSEIAEAEFEFTKKEKAVATHMLASAGTVGSTRNEPCEREAGSVEQLDLAIEGDWEEWWVGKIKARNVLNIMGETEI